MVYKLIDRKDGQILFEDLYLFEVIQIQKLMVDSDLIAEEMR